MTGHSLPHFKSDWETVGFGVFNIYSLLEPVDYTHRTERDKQWQTEERSCKDSRCTQVSH